MSSRIFTTTEFDRFARKAKVADDTLVEAIVRANRGLVDADLGGGIVKLRLARPGQGRSGGYRVIVAMVADARAIYLLGFAKNDIANVGAATLAELRAVANYLLAQSDVVVDVLVKAGELREIER